MRKYGKWLLVLGILAAYPAGVQAQSSTAAVNAAKQANQQKATEVGRAIQKARINGYDLKVEVRGDAVKIDGKVRDVRHRELAEKACRQVPGIRRVLNNLRYVPEGNVKQTSGRVSSGIRTAHHSTASGSGSEIEQVHFQKPGRRTTKKKAVKKPQTRFYRQAPQETPKLTAPKLTYKTTTKPGPVASSVLPAPKPAPEPARPLLAESKPIATPIAAPVVQKVNNNEVAKNIGAALNTMGLQNYDMEVRFADGKAVLAGTVATVGEREAIGRRVAQVAHVKAVDNQLKVSSPIAQTSFSPEPQLSPNQFPAAQFGPPQQTTYPVAMNPVAFQQAGQVPTAAPAPLGAAGNYSNPQLPSHAWPAYAQYPNSAAIQYPTQYSASAFPYIGPFYPYPQVPLGWRDVSLQWDDGFWQLKFNEKKDAWHWLFSPKNW